MPGDGSDRRCRAPSRIGCRMPAVPDDPHDQAEELLPWYATGQLEGTDRARVERHLASCARCQRRLGIERVLIDRVRSYAPDVEAGWARLRSRIEAPPQKRPRLRDAVGELWNSLRRPSVAAIAGAQVAFLAIAVWIAQPPGQPAFVGLGSAPAPVQANLIVMFRPDAREAELRAALESSGTTLVGGPTEADAYLLHVPSGSRVSALARLRSNRNVTMAQPIDG